MAAFAWLLVISAFLQLASGAHEKQLPINNGVIYYNESKVEECSWELPSDEHLNDHTLVLKLISLNLKLGEDCLGLLHIPGHGRECNQEPRTCYGYSNNASICALDDAVDDFQDCNELYWKCSSKLEKNDRRIIIDSKTRQLKFFNLRYIYFGSAEKSATTMLSKTTKAEFTTTKKRNSDTSTPSAPSTIWSAATDTIKDKTTIYTVVKGRYRIIEGVTPSFATSTIPSAATNTIKNKTTISTVTNRRDHIKEGVTTSFATSTIQPVTARTTEEERITSRATKNHKAGAATSSTSTIQSDATDTTQEQIITPGATKSHGDRAGAATSSTSTIQSDATYTTEEQRIISGVTKSHGDELSAATLSTTSTIQSDVTDTTEEQRIISGVTKSHSDEAGAATTSETSTIQSEATDASAEEITASRVTMSHREENGTTFTVQLLISNKTAGDRSEIQLPENNTAIAVIVVPIVLGSLVVISVLVSIWMQRRKAKISQKNPDLWIKRESSIECQYIAGGRTP